LIESGSRDHEARVKLREKYDKEIDRKRRAMEEYLFPSQ
jgi:hypothetical protein